MSEQDKAPEGEEQQPQKLSVEEAAKRIEEDPDFARQFLKGEVTPPPAAEPQPDQPPQGADGPQGGPGDDATPPPPQGGADGEGKDQGQFITAVIDGETVQISREDLGTYITGRKPGQALTEALRGLREKDETIRFMRERYLPENQSLRAELEKARKGGPFAPPPAQPSASKPPQGADDVEEEEPDTALLEQLESEEGVDLFDDNARKGLAKMFRSMANANARLRDELKGVQEFVNTSRQRETEAERNEAQARVVQAEWREIDDLLVSQPTLKPREGTFKDLDAKVGEFIRTVNDVAGGAHGYASFFQDTPEGKALRSRCESMGIRPPQDFERHQAVMHLRHARNDARQRVRESMANATGRQPDQVADYDIPDGVTPTYADLFERERRTNPQWARDLMANDPVQQHQAEADAARRAQQHAPEPPADAANNRRDVGELSNRSVAALLTRDSGTYTPDEARLVRQYYEREHIPVPAEVLAKSQ